MKYKDIIVLHIKKNHIKKMFKELGIGNLGSILLKEKKNTKPQTFHPVNCYICIIIRQVIMKEFLITFGIFFGVFALSFILMNIKHIFTGNEFRGSCASNNPMLKNEIGECTVCGKIPEGDCDKPEGPVSLPKINTGDI